MKIAMRLAALLAAAVIVPACGGGGDANPSSGAFAPAAGTLDPDFNFSGSTITEVGTSDDSALAMALQPDGKIVVVGYAQMSSKDFLLARYDAWGALDDSFGVGGIVTEDIQGYDDTAVGVVVQADGKIVVVGYSWSASNCAVALVRYDATGALDTSFGTLGLVMTEVAGASAWAFAAAADAEGRILVVGTTDPGASEDFFIARYEADGRPDPSFGSGDGVVITDFAANLDWAQAVAPAPGGKIVVAGVTYTAGGCSFAMARYKANGALDDTFGGGDGLVVTDLAGSDESANAVAVLADGRIAAAGYSYPDDVHYVFSVVQYEEDGTEDATFGTGGVATGDLSTLDDKAYGVALQPDGRIVVAGTSAGDVAVARFDASGALDATFGGGDGFVTTGSLPTDDYGYAVALQPDGRIVVAGMTYDLTADILICRLR